VLCARLLSLETASMKRSRFVTLAISFVVFSSAILKAQYQGDQQIGFIGLKAGTQPDPGIYVTLPLYWQMSDISIYGAQGNELFKNVSAALSAFVIPNLIVVTPYKILGATYGASFTQLILMES
jgi:hypothetical protein